MTKDFAVETTRERVVLVRENVKDVKFKFTEGRCPVTAPEQPRDRAWYIENVLNPAMARGETSDGNNGGFDDRKFWYDGASLNGDTIEVALGITYYQAFRADLGKKGRELLDARRQGVVHYNDHFAFLNCRTLGVAVLPITADGSIFIGERTNEEDQGLLNAVAGHLKYRENPADVDIHKDVFRELQEEFGIEAALVSNIRFVGVYSHPLRGDADATFLANVKEPDAYFKSGAWMKRVKDREHKPLVQLAAMADVTHLLQTGRLPESEEKYEVRCSTRGALMSIQKGEMND